MVHSVYIYTFTELLLLLLLFIYLFIYLLLFLITSEVLAHQTDVLVIVLLASILNMNSQDVQKAGTSNFV